MERGCRRNDGTLARRGQVAGACADWYFSPQDEDEERQLESLPVPKSPLLAGLPYSAAPPSACSRCFNTDAEGASVK